MIFEHVALQYYFSDVREVPRHLIGRNSIVSDQGARDATNGVYHASAVLAVVTVYVDYLSWNPQVQQGDVLNEQALSIAADLRRSLCGGSRERAEIGLSAIAALARQLAAVSSPRRPKGSIGHIDTTIQLLTNSENSSSC